MSKFTTWGILHKDLSPKAYKIQITPLDHFKVCTFVNFIKEQQIVLFNHLFQEAHLEYEDYVNRQNSRI